MPVVENVEFNVDPVVILKAFIKKNLRFIIEMKVVVGQVFNVVLDSNLECFSYTRKVYFCCSRQ